MMSFMKISKVLLKLYFRRKLNPPMKMEQSVPKRRNIKFRRRGITQKKAHNKLNFLVFPILFLRFGKIQCGSLFGLLTLLNKGRQDYSGIITMYLLCLTNSEPGVGYSQNFVHLQIAPDKRFECWFMM